MLTLARVWGDASGVTTLLEPMALLDGTAGFQGQCLPSPSPGGQRTECLHLSISPSKAWLPELVVEQAGTGGGL